ncbi:MAG TPA: hypothetical protein VJH90_01400 [archaeon]|nr:hypothetical protein [archaeon]
MTALKRRNGRLHYTGRDVRLVMGLHNLEYSNSEIRGITNLSIFAVEEIIESGKNREPVKPKRSDRERFIELVERVRAGEMIVLEPDYADNVYVGILESLKERGRRAHNITKYVGGRLGIGGQIERLKNDDKLIEYDDYFKMYRLTEEGRKILAVCPRYSKDINPRNSK